MFLIQTLYSQIVKISAFKYQSLTRITAVLLLMAFLIPTGLQSKQLVDFCMMEMHTHPAGEKAHHTGDMPVSHSNCDWDQSEAKKTNHTHNDCGYICACSIGQSQLGDEEWIPITKNIEITLTQQGEPAPFFTSSEHIQADKQIRIGEHDPPLWLLYDTFLM